MDVVSGILLTRAGTMSLAELQAAASIMQRCGRRDDMRALQAHFVRAVLDRGQLQGGPPPPPGSPAKDVDSS